MLGKLAKWLRILGFDTVYFSGGDRSELMRMAREESRVLLTRDTLLISRKGLPPYIFIQSDYPKEQLREVSRCYDIFQAYNAFSICSACNTPIKPISKVHLEGKIPEYIYTQHTKFSHCPRCGRIYWPGSHYGTMKKRLDDLIGEST
jgi:hypothetical protein